MNLRMREPKTIMDILSRISDSVLLGDDEQTVVFTRRAIDGGLSAKQILTDGFRDGMSSANRRFKSRELLLPDVLMSAKAMRAGMKLIEPLLTDEDVHPLGKVVLGSVHGDLHDIGKNLVGIMLQGAGCEVIDLGIDVAPAAFADAADQHGAAVIGMSALLTTTMPVMKSVVDLLCEQGLSGKVRTIIGGAPVSADFAREIGADGYAYDAVNAVDKVTRLIRGDDDPANR